MLMAIVWLDWIMFNPLHGPAHHYKNEENNVDHVGPNGNDNDMIICYI